VQGVGGALLFANATATLTDAFPVQQHGMAMEINLIAGIVGSFIGLVVGGVLADVHWRLVFWVNVPFGLFGTMWAYAKLREVGHRTASRIDWRGNLTFAAGLVMVLVGITYGIQPAGGHTMGWTSPFVVSMIGGGVGLLIAFTASLVVCGIAAAASWLRGGRYVHVDEGWPAEVTAAPGEEDAVSA
jgi:MFS family permease